MKQTSEEAQLDFFVRTGWKITRLNRAKLIQRNQIELRKTKKKLSFHSLAWDQTQQKIYFLKVFYFIFYFSLLHFFHNLPPAAKLMHGSLSLPQLWRAPWKNPKWKNMEWRNPKSKIPQIKIPNEKNLLEKIPNLRFFKHKV